MKKGDITYNELELIKELGSGNTTAFDRLYRQLYPALSLLAFKLSKSNEIAQDIVSDVFLHLWEGRNQLHHIENLRAYLYTSTRNRTLNYLKNKALRGTQELSERTMASAETSAETFFQALLHVETVRALREAIDALPSECKKVTELVLKGHSTNEISEMLGISASAVSHQKARAVRLLKDNLLLVMLLILSPGIVAF